MVIKVTKKEAMELNMPGDFLMKFAKHKVRSFLYRVAYTYETARGNVRENNMYLVARSHKVAENTFFEHIDYRNKKKPYRAISNVKILDIEPIGRFDSELKVPYDFGYDVGYKKPNDFEKNFIKNKLEFPVYKISYERTTKYGNTKNNHIYMAVDEDGAIEFQFKMYMYLSHIKKKQTEVSNVKILDTEKIGYIER